jgi:four helix bundle protein
MRMSAQSGAQKERTMPFAVDIPGLIDAFPNTTVGRAIAGQLVRGATSVASNYRATCNARSRREFVAKLGVLVDEADESAFWIELIRRGRLAPEDHVSFLLGVSLELRAIFAKSLGTARANDRAGRSTRTFDYIVPNDHTTR